MNLAERHQWADEDFFHYHTHCVIYSLGRKEPIFCEYSWLSLQLQQKKESSRPLSVIFFLQVILLVAAFFDACNRSLFGLRDIFIKQQ